MACGGSTPARSEDIARQSPAARGKLLAIPVLGALVARDSVGQVYGGEHGKYVCL